MKTAAFIGGGFFLSGKLLKLDSNPPLRQPSSTSSTPLLLPFLPFPGIFFFGLLSYYGRFTSNLSSRCFNSPRKARLVSYFHWLDNLSRLLTTFLRPGAYLQGHRCLPCRDPLVSYIKTFPDSSNNQQDWRGYHCAAVTCLSLSTLVCAANRCIREYILTEFYQATPTVNRDRLSSSTDDDLPIHSLPLDRCPSANPTIGCSRRLLRLV